jgi:hypothetical protein
MEIAMPTKIVDLSARSEIIRDEPFHVHFWECTPNEYRVFMGNPRAFLEKMGIKIPRDCRIETTIENHDWIGDHAPGMKSSNGTIICNVGGGNVARSVYRIVSYGHDHSTVGKYKKRLLHAVDMQEVSPPRKSVARKSTKKKG